MFFVRANLAKSRCLRRTSLLEYPADVQNAKVDNKSKTDAVMAWQRLPLPDAEEDTGTAKEPHASEETDDGKSGGGPQEGLEEMRCSARGFRLEFVSTRIFGEIGDYLRKIQSGRSCPE